MELLQDFCARYYFGAIVKVLPPVIIEQDSESKQYYVEVVKSNTRSRTVKENKSDKSAQRKIKVILQHRRAHPYDLHKVPENHRQLAVNPLLTALHHMLPNDAKCLLGLTMDDLYDGTTDSFVVGMAAGGSGIGIFSFARYDPFFCKSPIKMSAKIMEENKKLILVRSCKVMVHEIAHIFGIGHCVYFFCCMNGSGHLIEDYAQPLHLCPVDLHKFQYALGFDIVERYEALLVFYEQHKLTEESNWVRKRIEVIKNITKSIIQKMLKAAKKKFLTQRLLI